MLRNRGARIALFALTSQPAGDGGDGGATPPATPPAAPVPTPPATPPAPVPTPPAAPAEPPTEPPAEPTWDGKVESLHPDVQKMIRDLRGEAADRRTKFNTGMREIAAAMGVEIPGDEGAALTPEQLAEQLRQSQSSASELEATNRDQAVRLTLFETASDHGGNPLALTDSRAFLAKVSSLDPSAEDYRTQIVEAAKAAVNDNGSLKAVQATGPSTVDHAGGSGEAGDLDAQIAAARAAGNHSLAIKLQRRKAQAQ